jgi:ABC-2 type transport system ATP-binding protein
MIFVENVSKKYGAFEAVKDVSFSVGRDQVLGFLGPNGAGKTTIMKILTGFHFPSQGSVTIDGVSLEENPVEIKKRIGYLPESNPLYGDLNPEEYLNFAASVRLIPAADRQKALDHAISACGLEGVRKQRIESLSKGYKQRVGLAQAIIHDPPILILDEPTSGLDPNQIIEVRALIRELGKSKTVILSTHILQEVEAVCSRVLIINEGRLAAQGTPAEIAETMKAASQRLDTWELFLTTGKAAADIRASLKLPDRETRDLNVESIETGLVKLKFMITNLEPESSGSSSGESYSLDGELIFDWALGEGHKIIGMTRKKLSLEDIFVKLTNERLTNERLTNERLTNERLTSEQPTREEKK